MNEETIIDLIRKNDEPTIKNVYLNSKKSFFKIANRFNLPNDDILDIYQDSMVALIENVRNKKIIELNCTINTYLMGIGKFMIYNYLKREKNLNLNDYNFEKVENLDDFFTTNEVLNTRELQLKTAYEKLGEQCQQILKLFYFENKKLDDIQVLLNYENKDVLKSQKSRCISHLRKSLKQA